MPHFLDLNKIDPLALRKIIDDAKRMKTARQGFPKGTLDTKTPLSGHMVALIFEKPSTRTRVSFDLGVHQLGGKSLILNTQDIQLGHGETIADTARVLSRYVDMITLRTFDKERLLEFAEYASVPVINALTDLTHPCQIMADILTFEEHHGPIAGKQVLWAGDGNNVCHSFIQAAAAFDFELVFSGANELAPDGEIVADARKQGGKIRFEESLEKAAETADLVVTDSWVSMQHTKEDGLFRDNLLHPYQINDRIMALTGEKTLFMHCLPAHREQEVTSSVMDGPKSVVFDEAENRLHVQKAIMCWALGL